MTKNVTTPYGIGLWRSIRKLWLNLKERLRINIMDGRGLLLWKDTQLGPSLTLLENTQYILKRVMVKLKLDCIKGH